MSADAAAEEILGSRRDVITAVVAENVALRQKQAFLESIRSASYRSGTRESLPVPCATTHVSKFFPGALAVSKMERWGTSTSFSAGLVSHILKALRPPSSLSSNFRIASYARNTLLIVLSNANSKVREVAFKEGQKHRRPQYAAIMAGSTYVSSCSAAHLFEMVGILTDWHDEYETDNCFRSKAVKDIKKGKLRQDLSEGKGREQKPELTSRDFCR
ncbi:MAG: hypothetical protein SGPRY_006607 [Prymnesium sp.]